MKRRCTTVRRGCVDTPEFTVSNQQHFKGRTQDSPMGQVISLRCDDPPSYRPFASYAVFTDGMGQYKAARLRAGGM